MELTTLHRCSRPAGDRRRARRAGVDGPGRRRVESPLTLLREYVDALRALLAGSRSARRAVRAARPGAAGRAAGRPRRLLAGAEGRARSGWSAARRRHDPHRRHDAGRRWSRPGSTSRPAGPRPAGPAAPDHACTCWRRPGRTRGPGSSGRPALGLVVERRPAASGRRTTSPRGVALDRGRRRHGRAAADRRRARPRGVHGLRRRRRPALDR
jgi:hypothetical protein